MEVLRGVVGRAQLLSAALRTIPVGRLAFHQPTDQELLSGYTSHIPKLKHTHDVAVIGVKTAALKVMGVASTFKPCEILSVLGQPPTKCRERPTLSKEVAV